MIDPKNINPGDLVNIHLLNHFGTSQKFDVFFSQTSEHVDIKKHSNAEQCLVPMNIFGALVQVIFNDRINKIIEVKEIGSNEIHTLPHWMFSHALVDGASGWEEINQEVTTQTQALTFAPANPIQAEIDKIFEQYRGPTSFGHGFVYPEEPTPSATCTHIHLGGKSAWKRTPRVFSPGFWEDCVMCGKKKEDT